ncbi:hypothetical protein HanRHA438_Chr07g0319291 [Helianthus annuus]|uniref:Putative leucine-rich repeat domain, L domain-like protein n=1 Tax=Helianthus annuus TaxID=4232 RepID=A0A251UCQ1_HELAN|nr:hypothetical protein HanXRQr2_Chr07g0310221 [Helianthus annuus]KAJ0558333.1 hypothetical protein HanIR_Chr07g0335121 [Helianthus annuus]KAJ0564283.1 putative leucine-rich repeat domain superfamily [Helianthus annuus]KAJ0729612.1 putative leucine-rich repeat domain superfamily [Helianthus annuus]KAJ0905991.1 hypothetical protein HanPSC8_Chr07g0300391 [Helianthus annuus]
MQSCKLGPSFPMWIQSQRNFAYLDISNNGISDRIPEWFWDLPSGLKFLNLSSNEIKGTLPDITSVFERYPGIDLSNNQLEGLLGNIPRCFGNFTAMANRRLGDDVMSHYYSSYVSTLPWQYHHPRSIRYSMNRSAYTCPKRRGRNSSCASDEEALFTDNALVAWKGTQREFGRGILHLLKSIDISSNKLYGKLPSEITNLLELVSLNFSDNKLHGELPKHMGRLRSLDSLDLSRNEFSGNIPSSLSQLTRLSYLNLSYNNLSGRIPTGTQLQSFNYTSYSGNPQLCGLPLTQRCGLPSPPPPPPATVVGKEDRDEFWKSYYTGMGGGFAVGFLGLCGALFLNNRCRYLFFASLSNMKDRIYVTTVVHFRSLRRKFRQ